MSFGDVLRIVLIVLVLWTIAAVAVVLAWNLLKSYYQKRGG